MSRAIDADALIALVQDSTILGDGFKQVFCALVRGEPTIEPERKRGKWIRIYSRPNVLKYLGWTCSECGTRTGEEYAPRWFKYCPTCGAQMEAGEQE